MTFYNGPAAVILGNSVAVLMMFLFAFGGLPGWYLVVPGFRGFACWSLCSGFLVTSLVMLFWRPQTPVFLDRICISSDCKLKTLAILSLGGLVKKSDSMLIVWDPTWTERLWCLFELAAFLKSKKGSKRDLIIRPIFLGPISFAIFSSTSAAMIPFAMVPVCMDQNAPFSCFLPAILMPLCGVVSGYSTVSAARDYYRDLDTMKRQLLSLSFDTARCSCCDNGHVNESGGYELCDRVLVKQCVNFLVWQPRSFREHCSVRGFGHPESWSWLFTSFLCKVGSCSHMSNSVGLHGSCSRWHGKRQTLWEPQGFELFARWLWHLAHFSSAKAIVDAPYKAHLATMWKSLHGSHAQLFRGILPYSIPDSDHCVVPHLFALPAPLQLQTTCNLANPPFVSCNSQFIGPLRARDLNFVFLNLKKRTIVLDHFWALCEKELLEDPIAAWSHRNLSIDKHALHPSLINSSDVLDDFPSG